MNGKFKWDMFITSFIPLWISIMVADIWSIVDFGTKKWAYEKVGSTICTKYIKRIWLVFWLLC